MIFLNRKKEQKVRINIHWHCKELNFFIICRLQTLLSILNYSPWKTTYWHQHLKTKDPFFERNFNLWLMTCMPKLKSEMLNEKLKNWYYIINYYSYKVYKCLYICGMMQRQSIWQQQNIQVFRKSNIHYSAVNMDTCTILFTSPLLKSVMWYDSVCLCHVEFIDQYNAGI